MSTLNVFSLTLLASILMISYCTASIITNKSYFLNDSPPVYPSPNGTGTDLWTQAYMKAESMVARMSIEEKSNLTVGAMTTANGCAGYIPAIKRLDFPGMCFQDSGNGVRGVEFASSYPSGIHVGASWNTSLAYLRAYAMGGEFRALGANVALGPVVGPLGRVALGGRNWEGFSNDPYLCGSLASETVRGIQAQGVIASTKHFIGYEQETNRNPVTYMPGQNIESISSNIDDKTMHELYLWPFQDAVHAGTGSIMCSYNQINNSYGCQNSKTLNGLLKTELAFKGFVVSDWDAQHSGVASALSGLDIAMSVPGYELFWGSNLTEAIRNNSIPVSRLDDMATRILATWYQMRQDETYSSPGDGIPYDMLGPHTSIEGRDLASKQILLESAVQGHVLVKNINNALPLRSPKLISLFGYDAKAPDQNNPGPGYSSWAFGFEVADIDEVLPHFLDYQPTTPISQIAMGGTLISGGGSGSNNPSYINSPFDAIRQRAFDDGASVFWDFINVNATANVDPGSEACLVFINAFASESIDRIGLYDDYSDALINNVADQCSNTIVIIHNAGVRLVDQFIDHVNVTAVIFAHLPGQESGRALASILYGDTAPSGKLPYSVPMNESDYGSLLSPSLPQPPFNFFPQSNFTEGVYIDYRAFDLYNITPRYEFGYGLSYTTFSYCNLTVENLIQSPISEFPSGILKEGGMEDLWDIVARVNATIENSGMLNGVEVAQLYIGIPGGPIRQLRGFNKIEIPVRGKVTVCFELTRRDLSTWDTVSQMWKLQNGTYNIHIGGSSRHMPLSGVLNV